MAFAQSRISIEVKAAGKAIGLFLAAHSKESLLGQRERLLVLGIRSLRRAEGLDFIFGVAPALRPAQTRFEAGPEGCKARGAASSASSPACRGRCGRPRHALHRHQSDDPQRPRPLRGSLLPARTSGIPGQQVPPVPARERLLASVGLVRVNAPTTFGAIRRLAPAVDQIRRSRRRDEDDDQKSLADVVPAD